MLTGRHCTCREGAGCGLAYTIAVLDVVEAGLLEAVAVRDEARSYALRDVVRERRLRALPDRHEQLRLFSFLVLVINAVERFLRS